MKQGLCGVRINVVCINPVSRFRMIIPVWYGQIKTTQGYHCWKSKITIRHGNRQLLIYAQGNSILRKFHMCSIEVKVELFKTYCTPLYTAHLWTNYSCLALKNFYIAYHNVMKLFIGLPKREHNRPQCVQYNIPHGPALIRNFIYKFICRLYSSQNNLLYVIARSDCLYESQIRKKWRSLLYG